MRNLLPDPVLELSLELGVTLESDGLGEASGPRDIRNSANFFRSLLKEPYFL